MIWFSIISLAVGALLQRFKIIVLVPATLIVVVVAIGAGVVQTNGGWFTILTIAAASVSIQAGYLVGMLIQHGLGATKSSPFSHTTSARDSSTFRAPIIF
jgi:K+-transporting ATPase A subunit